MEIIKVKIVSEKGRKTIKTIIKEHCDYCSVVFTFGGGVSHYKRSKEHFCSRTCQAKGQNVKRGNKIHGLGGKGEKKSKRYLMWCSAKKRAKLKNIYFDIEIQDIPPIPEICPILGITIKSNNTNSPLDSSPSLDRIDNSLGYIKNNIQIISNRANRIKSNSTIEELEKIIKYLKDLQK